MLGAREASPDSPAITRIWQQLGQGAAADALLAGLIADGIGGTACVTLLVEGTSGQHRLFCRGTVGATVVKAAADGASHGDGQAVTKRIDGAGLLTWREQVVDGADRIFLGDPPADAALRLPVTFGVLLAGCVIIDFTNAAARATVSYDEEKPKKKTIVFFPDTITMTHPGRLAERASAASLAAGQHQPSDRGPAPSPAPSNAVRPLAPPGPSASGPAPPPPPGRPSPAGQGRPTLPAPVPFPLPRRPRREGLPGLPRPWPMPGLARRGWQPSFPCSFPSGPAPVTAGYPGTGGQPPAQYQGTPPPAAQPWQPVPDAAWSAARDRARH